MKILLGIIWTILILAFMVLSIIGVVTDDVMYVKLSLVLGGFLFYCILMLSINKDDYDDGNKAFPLIEYAEHNWDNWILNWIGAVLLLLAGQQIFGVINLMDQSNLTWSDGWYPLSGFLVNLGVDRWKAYQKKKKAETK